MSDEFARIARIRAILHRSRPDIVVAIGDDAAVLAPSSRAQVISVDAAVEDVHFRRQWAPLDVLGRRAFVAAVSDLAAMGASLRTALLSLILPEWLDDDGLCALVSGVAAAADDYGGAVSGGNLAAGGALSISTTVVGEVGDDPLRRDGGSAGDAVWITGTVGGAALGLSLLERSEGEVTGSAAAFVQRWLAPEARLEIGVSLVGRASAAVDISDGVLADLGHLCTASGVGAELHAGRLPLLDGHVELAARLGVDGVRAALTGGEDYELLFTGPPNIDFGDVATRVGRLTRRIGVRVLDATGRPLELGVGGYRHFE